MLIILFHSYLKPILKLLKINYVDYIQHAKYHEDIGN